MRRIDMSTGVNRSLLTTFTLTWLAALTPFVIASSVRASGNADDDLVSPTHPQVSTLSVPPLDHIEYPETRPVWVSQSPPFVPLGADSIVVVAGPCETKEECSEEMRWMKRAAISTYVMGLVQGATNADFYQLEDDSIDEMLVNRDYTGSVIAGGESKFEYAVQLQFSLAEKGRIREGWMSAELQSRLAVLGALFGMGLTLLVCSGGLLGIVSRRVAKRAAC